MVLKRISENTGRGAGGFLGGIANNPGIIIIAVALGALFFFRSDIRGAFGSLAESVGKIGDVQLPSISLPDITFPSIDITTNPVFEAGQQAGQAVFDAGKAFGDFVGSTQGQIDQALQNFFKDFTSQAEIAASNLGKDVQETITDPISTAIGGDFEAIGDFFSNLFGVNVPPEFQGPAIFPQTGESTFLDPDRPLDLFQFAEKFGIQPQEAFKIEKQFEGLDFEAIAAIPTFGEVLAENPELTASQIANLKFIQAGGGGDFDFGTNTGSGLIIAGGDFGIGDFNIEEQKAIEEAIANATLGNLGGGGLFANPDFPITLGEAFLGESGTIVSPSISNLNEEQLMSFVEAFG